MLSNSILEQCLAKNMSRFVIQDDGRVFLQRLVRHKIDSDKGFEWIDVDVSAYLAVVAGMQLYEQKMVNELVPETLRKDWRLGVQREKDWSVWTLYNQTLPYISLLDTSKLQDKASFFIWLKDLIVRLPDDNDHGFKPYLKAVCESEYLENFDPQDQEFILEHADKLESYCRVQTERT